MADTTVRDRYLQVLMNHVAEDRYPSATQMDHIEAMLTREQAESYLELLLDKLDDSTYPSIPMMNRIERVLQRFG